MKKLRLESVSTQLFVAHVIVEMLRTKNVLEASLLHSGSEGASVGTRRRKWMNQYFFQEKGETAFAISPDNVVQALKFRVPLNPSSGGAAQRRLEG